MPAAVSVARTPALSPRGIVHFVSPVLRSIAVRVPYGGFTIGMELPLPPRPASPPLPLPPPLPAVESGMRIESARRLLSIAYGASFVSLGDARFAIAIIAGSFDAFT